MEWLIPTFIIAFIAFVTTNIDALLLLILLFSQGTLTSRHIVAGQYLGFIIIILISTIGFFSKFIIPIAWIGFLGVIPIIIGIRGIKELIQPRKTRKEIIVPTDIYSQNRVPTSLTHITFEPLLKLQTYRVFIMTIGNGSDNISTYTPLFASGNILHIEVLISLFLLFTGILCYVAYVISRFPTVSSTIEHHGRAILPFAFIILGLFIMIQNGTLLLFLQLSN